MDLPSVSTSSLPAELWIQIFSYLPVPSLAAVSSLSKAFHAFFNDPQNESAIWRNAGLLHGLVGLSTLDVAYDGQACITTEPPRREWGCWREWERSKNPDDRHGEVRWSDVLDTYSGQSLTGLSGEVDWKGFFKRRLEIHRSWSGQLPSDIVRYAAEDIQFASSASKSHLANLHRARKLGETIAGDSWTVGNVRKLSNKQLLSPSSAVKARLDTIKAVLGIALDGALSPQVIRNLLSLEIQWTALWKSELPEVVNKVVPSTQKVHRIKVDERNGFALTTHRDGGLVVTDIHTKEILWCLPKNYVHEYAHLEYEQGYFIVDRTDGSKEVWRSSSLDPPSSVSAPAMLPDKKQQVASALANGDDDALLQTLLNKAHPTGDRMPEGLLAAVWARAPTLERGEAIPAMGIKDVTRIASSFRLDAGALPLTPFGWVNFDDLRHVLKHDGQPSEGEATTSAMSPNPGRLSPHFVPHMIIPVPQFGGQLDITRAFRFVYPYLLAASQTRAYVWDIKTGEQVQVVSSTQEFTVPESYPYPIHTPPPTGRVLFDMKKKRATYEEVMDVTEGEPNEDEHEVDGNFPVFRPFKSGFFDENATFSGNFGSSAVAQETPPPRSPSYPDPLSLQFNPPTRLGHLFYVELSERWVFVCGGEGLRVFARGREFFDHSDVLTRAKKNLGYDLQPGQLALRIVSDRIHYARWQASIAEESFREHWGSELVRQQVVWDEEVQSKTEEEANQVAVLPGRMWPALGQVEEPTHKRVKLHDEVLAVHVSPDQKHFVAMFSSSRLLFVPNFERVIAGETSVWYSGVDIQLGPVKTQSVYLNYGVGESGSGGSAGKITVVTEAGIFIVTPHLMKTASASGRTADLTVHRLAPSFMDPTRLRDISCLQMSDTGLWVNWHVPEPPKPPPPPRAPPAPPRYDPSTNPNHPYASGLRTDWLVRNGYLPAPGQGQQGEDAENDDSEEEDDEALEPYTGDDHDDEALEPYPGHVDEEEDEWEDLESDEDIGSGDLENDGPEEESEGEEERDIFDEGPNAAVYPGDQYFGSVSRSLREPEVITFFQRNGKTWKTSNRYPMVAMQTTEEERIQAESKQDGQAVDGQANSKGKEPERRWSSNHPPGRSRVWFNQSFPSDSTPPSQYVVQDGKCKWNYGELGHSKRHLTPEEKTSIDHETAFKIALGKPRMTKWGSPVSGTMSLPEGDLMVQTDADARVARRQEARFELHQIRFVPV